MSWRKIAEIAIELTVLIVGAAIAIPFFATLASPFIGW